MKRCATLGLSLLLCAIVSGTGSAQSPPAPPRPVIGRPATWAGSGVRLCYSGCGGEHAPVVNADYEQQVVLLVNQERARQGIPPLKRVWELEEAARYHATDMAQDNYFNHDTYDGGSYVCAWNDRIGTFYPEGLGMAENIAAGYATPSAVMAGWMDSSDHRANILRASNWEIGVGYYCCGGTYGHYWVQDFGRQRGVFPLIINSEAAGSDSLNVTLYVYGDWNEIRLRNDGGDWSAWRSFSNESTWALQAVSGLRTVQAEMRNDQESASAEDTIWLTTAPRLADLPDELVFLYSSADNRLVPGAYHVPLINEGDNAPLSWTATGGPSWIVLSASSGATPYGLWVNVDGSLPAGPRTLSGTIRVKVTFPSGVAGSPQDVGVVVHTTTNHLAHSYVPLALK